MKSLVLSCFLAFYPFFQTSAQNDYRPGYVVTVEGDTIRGFVLYKENQSRFVNCTFKIATESQPIDYTSEQLNAYGMTDDRSYKTKEINVDSLSGKHFFEILTAGKVALLHAYGRFFLEDKSGNLFELRSIIQNVERNNRRYLSTKEEFKNILVRNFRDCQSISAQINFAKLEMESLTNLFEAYNNCSKADGVITTQNLKPWSIISLGSQLTMATSKLNNLERSSFYGYTDKDKFSKDISIFPGINFNFSSPRISERLFVQVDFLYSITSFESSKTLNQAGITTISNATFRANHIQFPLSLGYRLPLIKIRAVINIEAGVNMTFLVHSKSLLHQETIFSDDTVFLERENNSITASSSLLSPFGSLGIQKGITHYLDAFFKLRYQYGNSMIDAGSPKITQTTIYSTVGVSFLISR